MTSATSIQSTAERTKPTMANPGSSVREVVQLFQQHNTGCVIIVDADNHPIGIVADRDPVMHILSNEQTNDLATDPKLIPIKVLMPTDPITVEAGTNVLDIFRTMAELGCRRVPITEENEVIDIITFDDLVRLLTKDVDQLATVLSREAPRTSVVDLFYLDRPVRDYEGRKERPWIRSDHRKPRKNFLF